MTIGSPGIMYFTKEFKVMIAVYLLAASVICQAAAASARKGRGEADIYWSDTSSEQVGFSLVNGAGARVESPYHPRIDYAALDTLNLEEDEITSTIEEIWPPRDGMGVHALHVSGDKGERVNLMIFADGYTVEEEDKFIVDAQKLTDDIISENGAMGHVAHLLNVWGVYVPSKESGIGTNDLPLKDAPFGLYRPGNELRAVYLAHHKRARKACAYFNTDQDRDYRNTGTKRHEAACDQPIILGNDPLYGGLGGEFTIITASEMNTPLVLRHELGHSLIPVGEEYEGGFAYFGANSDKVTNLHNLKWRKYLSSPEQVRIEDVKVPLQVYPWHNLDNGSYNITFTSSNAHSKSRDSDSFAVSEPDYPTALLRISFSSIPYPSHIHLTLNDKPINLSSGFSDEKGWIGSLDRRWVEVDLPALEMGEIVLEVQLTEEGRRATPGQGGKILGSLEVVEYAGGAKFNKTKGLIGAFPTYAMDGSITLRPTNEECLMRKVNHPTFCPVCADALRHSLERRIEHKKREKMA